MSAEERRVAVVGAGPAGLFTIQPLLDSGQVGGVDVFEMLPSPYGLIRYGVAPDHSKTKTVIRALERQLARPGVRFLGNVQLGANIARDELKRHYDAVVYAVGAPGARSLDIPGENLSGSYSARDFVDWYCGHPDARVTQFPVAETSAAVVVGAGNVALDVVRMLAKGPDELRATDIPEAVLTTLSESKVKDIHVVLRCGPEGVKFTPTQLRELGEISGVNVVVDRSALVVSGERPELSRFAQNNLDIFREWSTRKWDGACARRIHFHFVSRPIRLEGHPKVAGIVIDDATVGHSGERHLAAQLVIRAVGYRVEHVPGLPFNAQEGRVPNVAGSLAAKFGADAAGEYVSGWLKRGPSGVIGTNRADALETAATLLSDLPSLPPRAGPGPNAVLELLKARGVQVVSLEAWKRLERLEVSLGRARGSYAVKIADRDEMLRACL